MKQCCEENRPRSKIQNGDVVRWHTVLDTVGRKNFSEVYLSIDLSVKEKSAI